jgi:hypothetical protein
LTIAARRFGYAFNAFKTPARGITKAITRSTNWRWRRCRRISAFELTPALKDRIEFLAGEPDRWRNVSDLPLKHFNGPDHYIDLEDLKLYGLTPETLPSCATILSRTSRWPARRTRRNFRRLTRTKDADHTRELDGFLPWAITEYYEKLKSDFGTLRALKQYGGTPGEIANAQADIVYVMGVMGHFVGDGSQPLHTTVHFNGWVGDNPKGYTTGRLFTRGLTAAISKRPAE